MENDGEDEPRWPIDLEARVAKNVRRLREGRGISQHQLGADLAIHGVGMHQTTVAKLEAGSKPLRLNEVLAIAAYFEVPIESLWEESMAILGERSIAVVLAEISEIEAAIEDANMVIIDLVRKAQLAQELANKVEDDRREAMMRQKIAAASFGELLQRRDAARAVLEGLGHVEH
jgi:transcriptional regulator with XRE-family HTH domain